MELNPPIFLFASGVFAGFIDSIAGGGGLITVPCLSLFLGLGPETIGTNKIAGTIAALVALAVYCYKGHMDWKRGWLFTIAIGLGSFLGSYLNPFLPPHLFRFFLLFTCPTILWIVWKKELWIAKETPHPFFEPNKWTVLISGILCGFYDGIWGPGGGTLMFLSLFFMAKLPLLTALAISKLANFTSASVSLFNFARGGYVQWGLGLSLASGIIIGAFLGAHIATQKTTQIIRPILLGVVLLLLTKVLVS